MIMVTKYTKIIQKLLSIKTKTATKMKKKLMEFLR